MMNIDELLDYCQAHHIVLVPGSHRVTPWAGAGQRIPRTIRTAIREHTPELGQLIASADARVCPSPGLHAAMWETCFVCQRLDAAMRGQSRPRSYRKAG